MKTVTAGLLLAAAVGMSAAEPKGPDAMDKSVTDLTSVHDGHVYKNYEKFNLMGDSSFVTAMKDWFFSDNVSEPKKKLPYTPVDTAILFTGADSVLRATWLGHSSFIIEHDGLRILLDPVLTNNVSPVPWLYSVRRFQENCPVPPGMLPEIDVAVISHNHYDHLDKKTIKAIHHKVGRFVVPLGVDRYLKDWGVPAEKIRALDWSGSVTVGRHTFTALPAQHFSGRGILQGNKTLWASFAVQGPYHAFYFSGDSGYHAQFKVIGQKYGPFDLVMLDSGQFNVHWPKAHMFPEEAVQAHIDLQGKVYIPAHWGSFNLSPHNWFDPIDRAVAAGKEKDVRLAIPYPGQTIDIGELLPDSRWWEQLQGNGR